MPKSAHRTILALALVACSYSVGELRAQSPNTPPFTVDPVHPAQSARWASYLIDQHGPLAAGPDRAFRRDIADTLDQLCGVQSNSVFNPLLDPVNGPFLGALFRIRMLEGLRRLSIDPPPATGVKVYKLYSSCFVVRDAQHTVGFDFAEGPFILAGLNTIPLTFLSDLADQLDLLLVSHVHADHLSVFLMAEMVARGKPVLAPQEIINVLLGNGYLWATAVQPAVGGLAPQVMGGLSTWVFEGRQWPGVAAGSAKLPPMPGFAPVNNVYALRMGGLNIVHFGDNNDVGVLPWLSSLAAMGMKPDLILMVSYLGPQIQSITQAPLTLLGHEYEFGHAVGAGFTFLSMQPQPDPDRRVLFWGESLLVTP